MGIIELNPFKKGDWVQCVSNYYSTHLSIGDLYEIIESGPYTVTVKNDTGEHMVLNFRSFAFPIKRRSKHGHLTYIEVGRIDKPKGGGHDFTD